MEEEIKEEKLDSPLVVHKKSDASYQEAQTEVEMQTTHIDEDSDAPTLERHRFKKVKKKKKWPYVLVVLVVALIVVLAVMFNNGTIKLPQHQTTSETKKSYTTEVPNSFADTITVKGTYLFYEGNELDDIGALEREIKYQDENKTFTVQDEHADSNFLNKEVLPLLTKYNMKYNVTYIESSGLISKYETTSVPEVTEAAPTEAPAVTEAAPTEAPAETQAPEEPQQ